MPIQVKRSDLAPRHYTEQMKRMIERKTAGNTMQVFDKNTSQS